MPWPFECVIACVNYIHREKDTVHYDTFTLLLLLDERKHEIQQKKFDPKHLVN